MKPANLMPRPENAFIVLALLFGLSMVALIPPFHAPDEWNHFFRAYQVSEGKWSAEKGKDGRVGGYLPKGLVITAASVFFNIPYSKQNMPRLYEAVSGSATTEDDLFPFTPEKKSIRAELSRSLFDIPLEPEQRVFVAFANTGRFAPVAYLPQALGIGAGRLLGASPVGLMYMARLCNLALWIGLTWMAIRLMPIGRQAMYLLALMPVALYQASSVSADPVTNSAAFLLIAAIITRATGPDEGRGGLWIIGLASVVVAITKFYIFLPAMYGIVALRNRDRGRGHLMVAGGLVAVAAITAGGWIYLTREMITPLRAGIDPGGQLAFMLADPVRFIGILAGTFRAEGMMYAAEFVAQMGHVKVPVPGLLTATLWAALIFSALWGERDSIDRAGRGLAGAVLIASAGTFVLLSYLTWTPVGEGIIQGIQGRYFIPLGPVALLVVARARGSAESGIGMALTALPLLTLGVTLWVLIRAYY